MAKLLPPLTYQGGKQRIAGQILDIIKPDLKEIFWDLCCGSGAISIELINRGHPPQNIFMLDKGPWGLFWKMIGNGTFDLHELKKQIDKLPTNIADIQGHIKEISKQDADIDTIYVYLLLQASSFGGKAIWVKDNKWQNCSFRSYWLPTETSNRRSHVNPMMPMPNTLFERVAMICEKMKGIKGHCGDIRDGCPSSGIVYIDPPYQNSTKYGCTFDVLEYASKIKVPCYISEGKPLSEQAWLISSGRKKGGISGDRKKINEEWLSLMKD